MARSSTNFLALVLALNYIIGNLVVHTPNNLVNVNPVCCALGLGLGKDYTASQTFIFQFDSQLRDFSYVISCEIMRGVFRHLQRQGGLAK